MNATGSALKGVATQNRSALDDDALLSEFQRSGDDAAFRALAARHARWLYAAAFRALRDRHAAEDATQAVFVLLWQRAGGVAGRRKVTGWLFRAVGYTSRAMKRAERRRRKHEYRAAIHNRGLSDEPAPPRGDVDAAVAALGDADRTALLLRFHRGLDFVEVARELGVSPAAARQRVSRAVGRLRAKLGTEVGSLGLASAVACGAHPHPTVLVEQSANAALKAARGGGLAGGVETALKGAIHLMAMTKIKAAVAFVAMAAVLATSTAAVMTRHRTDDTSDEAYALAQGEAIRQVLFVPPAERLEFMRRHSPAGERLDQHPESAMIVKWKDGRASLWGRKSSTHGWYTLGDLVGHFVEVPTHEFEGRQALRNLRLRGDFAVNREATTEQYRAGIEKIVSAEIGKKAVLAFRDVERPVVVFRGRWIHTRAKPGAKPTDGIPTLDLYGTKLNPVPGRDGAGTPVQIAAVTSNYIGQQVLFECQGAPERLWVRLSDPVPGNPLAGLPAAEVNLVLRHIEEQTGLKAAREKRKVRRLFVEAD